MADKQIIYLTDRRPVSIDPDEWPIIAVSHGDEPEPNEITVRQHEDGRILIYLSNGDGGKLLTNIGDAETIIMQLGEGAGMSPLAVQATLNSLPPEELNGSSPTSVSFDTD